MPAALTNEDDDRLTKLFGELTAAISGSETIQTTAPTSGAAPRDRRSAASGGRPSKDWSAVERHESAPRPIPSAAESGLWRVDGGTWASAPRSQARSGNGPRRGVIVFLAIAFLGCAGGLAAGWHADLSADPQIAAVTSDGAGIAPAGNALAPAGNGLALAGQSTVRVATALVEGKIQERLGGPAAPIDEAAIIPGEVPPTTQTPEFTFAALERPAAFAETTVAVAPPAATATAPAEVANVAPPATAATPSAVTRRIVVLTPEAVPMAPIAPAATTDAPAVVAEPAVQPQRVVTSSRPAAATAAARPTAVSDRPRAVQVAALEPEAAPAPRRTSAASREPTPLLGAVAPQPVVERRAVADPAPVAAATPDQPNAAGAPAAPRRQSFLDFLLTPAQGTAAAAQTAPAERADDAAPLALALAEEPVATRTSRGVLDPAAFPRRPAARASGGVTITRDVRLRSRPDTGSSVITVVQAGSPVQIVSCNGWCEVRVGGQQGFVYRTFLSSTK